MEDKPEGGLRYAANHSDYQAEPIQNEVNSAHTQPKKDPYVVRATKRAKIKIWFQIFG